MRCGSTRTRPLYLRLFGSDRHAHMELHTVVWPGNEIRLHPDRLIRPCGGSGLASIINPCLQKLMQTKNYYEICQKHGLTQYCYPNYYFPSDNYVTNPWEKPTDQATSACSSGYCSCGR